MDVCHVFLDCKNGNKFHQALHILWRLMLSIYKHACSTTLCMFNKDSNIKCLWTSFFPRWKLPLLVFNGVYRISAFGFTFKRCSLLKRSFFNLIVNVFFMYYCCCITACLFCCHFEIILLKLRENFHFRGYYGPYIPAFGLIMERYSVSLRIQPKCGKIRTR